MGQNPAKQPVCREFCYMATFTQEQYDSLLSAYSKGVLEVMYADQRVIYRSLKEMRSLLNEMAVDLGVRKPWDGRTKITFKNGL